MVTEDTPPHMSGALFIHLEDLFDEINEKSDDHPEIRDEEVLSVRDFSKGHRRDNRVFVVTNRTRALPVTTSYYGWLELYVDCKLKEDKRNTRKSLDDPSPWNGNHSGGHQHEQDLSSPELIPDFLTVEQKDEMEKPQQRCISRSVSLFVECDNEEEVGNWQSASNASIETIWDE